MGNVDSNNGRDAALPPHSSIPSTVSISSSVTTEKMRSDNPVQPKKDEKAQQQDQNPHQQQTIPSQTRDRKEGEQFELPLCLPGSDDTYALKRHPHVLPIHSSLPHVSGPISIRNQQIRKINNDNEQGADCRNDNIKRCDEQQQRVTTKQQQQEKRRQTPPPSLLSNDHPRGISSPSKQQSRKQQGRGILKLSFSGSYIPSKSLTSWIGKSNSHCQEYEATEVPSAFRRCVSNKELGEEIDMQCPYTHVAMKKVEIEARMQVRLEQLKGREKLISSWEVGAFIPPKVNSPPPGILNTSSWTKGTNDSIVTDKSKYQNQTRNQTRNRRRAEHTQAVIDDLCEIVTDLFLAESKLLRFQIYQEPLSPKSSSASVASVSSHKRGYVMDSVRRFLSDLPVRYALGVETPSEVLVHMRLMSVARGDEFSAAVHIVKVEDERRNVRLVTISCRDCVGLLEYITRLLATGGSRVLDADVMTTTDNVTLDRFLVEMKGRLRLDKLQQYIQTYLEQKHEDIHCSPQNETYTSKVASPNKCATKSFISNLSGCSSATRALPHSPPSIEQTHGQLYFHPPKETLQTALPLAEVIESAVPMAEVIRSTSRGDTGFVMNPLFRTNSLDQGASSSFKEQRPNAAHERPATPTLLTQTSGDRSGEVQHILSKTQQTSSPLNFNQEYSSSELMSNKRRQIFTTKPQKNSFLISATDHKKDEYGESRIAGDSTDGLLGPMLQGRDSNPLTIYFDELMLIDCLSNGRVSDVYRGVWKRTCDVDSQDIPELKEVALKVVTNLSGDTTYLDELRREGNLSSSLHHNNICQLVGIAQNNECVCLAYKFYEGGSLQSLLLDTSRCYDYLPIALDVANGMAYLHSRHIIHRDLKPSNIFLTKDNRAKVADFGMSVANKGQELTAETGTYRWMAPEIIRHESYSSNADVYSFGIVLWQLITREVPFATLSPVQTAYAVAEGKRPHISSSTPEQLRKILVSCWDEDSQKRPSFTYIAMALADYAQRAFNPANVGAQTVEIANEMLANVEGNSTVNVDYSTHAMATHSWTRQSNSSNASNSSQSGYQSNNFHHYTSTRERSGSSSSNIGLEINI